MELSGGQILVQCLKDEGVEFVFGYPGGSVLHIYDAIFHQDDVKHILVRHEQAAAHSADAYARATGKPGVVLVTSGPGATNAVTGIATAYMDSIPMVIISGQVPSPVIGSDAFQEVDTVGITRPCVKHNFLVKDVNDLAETMKKAFYVATTGRPGPVLVDVPKDITDPNIKVPYKYPKKIVMRSYNPVVTGHKGQIKRAVDMLLAAQRPIIYSGGGVILGEGHQELTELTQLLGFPITNTLMGLGAYPATDKQFVGMLGMHGTYEANMAMHESDVILAVGARFDDRVTGKLTEFCPYAKIIHIDVDPASISKTVKVDVPIVGEVKPVLKQMLELIRDSKDKPSKASLENWWKLIDSWRGVRCLEYDRESRIIKPQYVVEQLYEVTNGEAFVTSDVGQHQMYAAQYYHFDKPRRWINSGGLGTMGFGLPAAIGVKLAFPEADVACITGEASIQMCIQELSTALQYNTPVKIVNLNNRYMGMVRQWQEFSYQSRYSHSYMDTIPDFVKLAEAYGHVGMRIEKPEEVRDALKQAFEMKDRTVFLDFITDRTENVYPMIEAGKAHHDMKLRVAPGTPVDRELS
ncbi:acetolactate synthase 3 large subunit [Methylomonas sp. MED-D]|uniref:Acetolactate synthase n=1 Tax=Methylomonas koyamae TaxID=702114 RepID=A0A177P0N4_9GAMM|nr:MULTISPECIES: acetolactate synthase 3 large subunit [Methylomonas]NJA07523.1 acetolactate synthase 3 large subunit [Methylococcaceae bacterium WWC4]MDT4330902.1 acetolactate synthase 3 large subunit [Methylomonas sp. MV1]OAI22880.1 acetolactate synthase 3 catalytic subunit [Methylomonas koyamae]OHX37874.1 acetolactate synthase, large subunit, biosynthetic type [Methylomonas sp. LWB]WGS84945.1 acetolactate synthase 3 large subunit [Methylomonas sp. UP202]